MLLGTLGAWAEETRSEIRSCQAAVAKRGEVLGWTAEGLKKSFLFWRAGYGEGWEAWKCSCTYAWLCSECTVRDARVFRRHLISFHEERAPPNACDAFMCAWEIMGVHSLFFPFIFCGSKTKRADRSDDEEERDPENVKKKRKRIKQLQSDSSDEEGKKICKQWGM